MTQIFRRFFAGRAKPVLAWILGVMATVVLGVGFQTQNVISKLNAVGAEVSLGDRLSMTAYDIFHLGSLYGIFISVALAIAFLIGERVIHFAKANRTLVYAAAGAVAIWVLLFTMKTQFFDTHIIAGARDAIGISLQMLAGAVGGFVFSKVSLQRA